MEISAINNRYNIATKAQYDSYQAPMATNYPAYVEEESPKSSSMLGATLLGIIGIAGLGYGIYKHRDAATLAKELATKKGELDEVTKKLADSEEAHNVTKKALETSTKEVEQLKETAKKKFSWSSLKFWKNWGKKKA